MNETQEQAIFLINELEVLDHEISYISEEAAKCISVVVAVLLPLDPLRNEEVEEKLTTLIRKVYNEDITDTQQAYTLVMGALV